MSELLVDFNDPESVGRAIPRAKALIQKAERQAALAGEEAARALERASDAELEIRRWKAVLQALERVNSGVDVEASPAPRHSSDEGGSKDQALRIVIAINGPTSIAEVAEHMSLFSRKTVSWALWKLADEGAIQRLGHGRYAPLDYVPGQPTTNYLTLPHGFPAPSKAQISRAVETALSATKTP
ncbi:MAG TPA: hypothetical protein VMG62_06205 [Solirubrobacteraceae bacterium]|nr:hypothetical protein [Solirubrobacteraceae bacterium]